MISSSDWENTFNERVLRRIPFLEVPFFPLLPLEIVIFIQSSASEL